MASVGVQRIGHNEVSTYFFFISDGASRHNSMMFSKEQSDSKMHSAFFDSFWKEVVVHVMCLA